MFVQVQDSTPPTFVSSGFDGTALTITFSETIAAANVDPAKIHVRESGSYTGGGITLTAGELDTSADADAISFALTESNLAAVKGLDTPELTIEPGAVRDTAGNPIVGTFDVSTATYIDAFDVSGSEASLRGMAFSSNGTKMFVVGSSGDTVHEYDLSAPFDVSTASSANDAFSVSGQETSPRGMAFSSDGAKMFVAGGRSTDYVHEYALTAPFDVSTATHTANVSVSTQDNRPEGVAFSSDGSKMFIAGEQNDRVYEYALGTPFDVTSYSFTASFDVSEQVLALVGVAFSNDGAKMFVVGSNRASVYEYALTAPFDVSTASPVDSFGVSEQVSAPTGMAFSSDGAKMFVAGSGSTGYVHEYALSSVYPIAMAFVTTWETTGAGQTITIPATGTYSIDWGDGTVNATASGTQTHNYASAGSHTVAITGGLESININSLPSQAEKDKLRSIDQWGNITWTTMGDAFHGASNMAYDAADTPDLSGVASMNSMFRDTSFSANLSGWNVSQVTDVSRVFQGSSFNGDLSGWNVSRVQNMQSMFSGASSFDKPLNDWDVSSVTNMRFMFFNADRFNQDLGSWTVSSVETMESMFGSGVNSAFNGNISGWDVSRVQDMRSMFYGASSFDGNLSGWNVSSVTSMIGMFREASFFDQSLNNWNVSSVTSMTNMFLDASSFNQPLNDWDVSRVQGMRSMFSGASSFDKPLNDWDVSRVQDMRSMFSGASSFDKPLNDWDVSRVQDMRSMFSGASFFNQPLNDWNVSSVTSMTSMFADATNFDQNLGEWYVVLNGTEIDASAAPGVVGTISAQNSILGTQATYGIGTGGDSASFNIAGRIEPEHDRDA